MSVSLSHPTPTKTTMALAPTLASLDATHRTKLPVRLSLSILCRAWVQWLHSTSSIVLDFSSPSLVPIILVVDHRWSPSLLHNNRPRNQFQTQVLRNLTHVSQNIHHTMHMHWKPRNWSNLRSSPPCRQIITAWPVRPPLAGMTATPKDLAKFSLKKYATSLEISNAIYFRLEAPKNMRLSAEESSHLPTPSIFGLAQNSIDHLLAGQTAHQAGLTTSTSACPRLVWPPEWPVRSPDAWQNF